MDKQFQQLNTSWNNPLGQAFNKAMIFTTDPLPPHAESIFALKRQIRERTIVWNNKTDWRRRVKYVQRIWVRSPLCSHAPGSTASEENWLPVSIHMHTLACAEIISICIDAISCNSGNVKCIKGRGIWYKLTRLSISSISCLKLERYCK